MSDKPSRKFPHELIWALATLSLILPFAALGLGVVGLWKLLSGESGGWQWVGAGVLCLVLDLIIDLGIANPHTSASEDPDLNCRGSQCIGRIAELVEPIEGGRGKVRLGDTVWTVECADNLPAGAFVRVVGSNGAVLRVEAA
ncbi:MAG: NfeD family protein [Alphaproteobacteria bacterium]|nr:NfeD family protein [Alphaproteobacteria bacterium]